MDKPPILYYSPDSLTVSGLEGYAGHRGLIWQYVPIEMLSVKQQEKLRRECADKKAGRKPGK